MRLVDHAALCFGRGECPCDGDGLRRGEGQIHVADPASGRVHALVVLRRRHLGAGGGLARQDVFALVRREVGLLGA